MADYHHVAEVMEGLTAWHPIGSQATGVGARYRVELAALHVRLRGVLAIDIWDPPRALGWTSEGGPVRQTGRWTFTERGPGRTLVKLEVGYQPPGGLLGNLLAGQVEPLVKGRVVRALERMRDELEEEGGE